MLRFVYFLSDLTRTVKRLALDSTCIRLDYVSKFVFSFKLILNQTFVLFCFVLIIFFLYLSIIVKMRTKKKKLNKVEGAINKMTKLPKTTISERILLAEIANEIE